MSSSSPAPSGLRGRQLLERLAAGTALVVSLASLYIAWRQSALMERQLAASVWPSLEAATGNANDDGSKRITLVLHNTGIGPARIRSFELSYHGVPLHDSRELLAACCDAKGRTFTTTTSRVVGR